MDKYTAKTINNFLEEYSSYYRRLILFLHKKHNKILADDLDWLMDSLNEEQAFVMEGKSFEQKRLQLFKAMGVENYTATMLIENAPHDYSNKIKTTCTHFTNLIKEVKRINDLTTEIVEKKLDGQKDFVKKAGILNRPKTYNVAGKKVSTVSAHSEKTIIGDF